MRRFQSILFASAVVLMLLFPPQAASQVGSPAGPIPPGILEARRGRLLELLGGAPAVFSSSRQRATTGVYPQDSDYREDNNFFYFTGIEAEGAWLVLSGPSEGDAVLYLPGNRSTRMELFAGPQLGPGPEAISLTGIQDVRPVDELPEDLQTWFGADSRPQARGETVLFVHLGDPTDQEILDTALRGSGLEVEDAAPALASLRLLKDQEGIRRLRRAAEITMEAHREAWRIAAPGVPEYEVEAALEFVMRVNGAERLGFPSTVGSGPNGTILHYDKSRRTLEDGDLVVVDIGAEFGYYAADITRTFPANGRFSPRQRALYDLVLGAWNAAVETVRPGIALQELTGAIRSYYAENSGDLCGDSSCVRFLPHRASHWLGMDYHDVGDPLSSLAPGMVLTVEPGLYFPDEGLGVRIADFVLVTSNGCEVLTQGLARTPEEIEAIMREAPRWVRGSVEGSSTASGRR